MLALYPRGLATRVAVRNAYALTALALTLTTAWAIRRDFKPPWHELESENANRSLDAAFALSRRGEEGLDLLLDAVRRGNSQARAHAAGALGSMVVLHPALRGKVEAKAVPVLARATKDPEGSVRHNAVVSLTRLGTAAVVPLAEVLSDPQLGGIAAEALGHQGRTGVAALRKALTSDSLLARQNAEWALPLAGPDAVDAVPDLIRLISGPDGGRHHCAVDALGRIGAKSRDALPVLEKLLRSAGTAEFGPIARSMSRIKLSPERVPELRSLFAKPGYRVHDRELSRLLASAGAGAVSPLAEGLSDDRPEIRHGCLLSLELLGPAAAPAAMAVRGLVPDKACRLGAVSALVAMEEPVGPSLPLLIADLATEAQFGSDPAGRPLFQSEIVQVLSRIGPDAVPALTTGLGSPSLAVQAGCASALGRIGPSAKAAAPHLRRLLENTANETVKMLAAGALRAIDPGWE